MSGNGSSKRARNWSAEELRERPVGGGTHASRSAGTGPTLIMRSRPFPRRSEVASRHSVERRSTEKIEALVLDLLSRSNGPLSAYDIASRSIAIGNRIVPNQAYRTLARLMERGTVIRLESLSAYMLRQEPFDSCLICDHCHAVQLLASPETVTGLARWAERSGFTMARTIVEMHGRCADCATGHDNGPEQRRTPPSPSIAPSTVAGV